MPDCILFMLLTMVLLIVVYVIFYNYSKKVFDGELKIQHEFFSLTERFYELIFSGGSIIGFMAAYYLINRFVTSGPFYNFWEEYSDYLLLIFMIISIMLNSFSVILLLSNIYLLEVLKIFYILYFIVSSLWLASRSFHSFCPFHALRTSCSFMLWSSTIEVFFCYKMCNEDCNNNI